MFPPERIATVFRRPQLTGAEQARRHRSGPAGLCYQPGLPRESADRGEHLLFGHGNDVGHQLADVGERLRADPLNWQHVHDRPLDVGGGPRDPLTAAQGLAGVRGELGPRPRRPPRAGVLAGRLLCRR